MVQLSEVPIIQAPMAGGPSTPALAAAVGSAGGYGFVAGGYLSPAELREMVRAVRASVGARFGVNLFVPSDPGDALEVAAYARTLQPEADRLGVALGVPVWDDDDFEAKVDLVEEEGVDLVSFTFGCPTATMVDRLHRSDCRVAVTVTSGAEASLAESSGADALVVQGTESGGHQGGFLDLDANHRPLLSLLAGIRETVGIPLIGAGGVMSGVDVAAVLGGGAVAVQMGTAFLCSPEAGTSPVYRRALLDARYPETIVTRAYSGRFARGLANEFGVAHSRHAPRAYPEVHHLTRPLRAAATRAGDASVPNLWAGAGWRQVTSESAAGLVRRVAAEARRTAG
ncbi:MAG: nitronate monooxygenase [Acidimicrobiales bacterium]|jgi:nitronate monooxygenase